MQNKLFYPLFILLIFVFNSCSYWGKNEENSNDFKIIKEKALLAEKNNKIDSSFYYLSTISIDNKYSINNVVYASLEKARLYYNLGDFSECEAEATEAQRINIDPIYNPYINNMLGTTFQEQKRFSEAIKQFELGLKQKPSSDQVGMIKNNIGVVYLEDNKFEEAIKIYEPLLIDKSLIKNPYIYSKILDNLGFAYLKTNHPNSFNLLTKGLILKDSIKEDDFGKISSLIHLSNYYEKQSNIEKANEFALKAYSIATATKSPDDRLEALDILIKNNTNNKEWYLKYAHINDSIQKERNRHKNQFAQIKYNASKAENESKLYKEQKEKLLIGLIGIILLSIGSFILIRNKNKQKQLKTVYDTETRIARQLHDELANEIFNTLTFAETKDISISDNKEKVLSSLDKIYKSTRSISHENSSIDVGTEFKSELQSLFNNFISPNIQIITKGLEDIQWKNISTTNKITLYRVMQELMINMKKHSQCSVVFITLSNNNKNIEIKYADNGIGIKEQKFKNGLQNVENRIESINGTITFESNKGLKVKISIPI